MDDVAEATCDSTYVVGNPYNSLLDLYVCERKHEHQGLHMDFTERKAWGAV